MNKTVRILAVLPAALFLAASPVVPIAHAGQTFSSEYVVSAIGFRVGKTQFKTTIDPKGYKVSGTLKASGFASLLSSVTGSLSVKGTRAKDDVRASGYTVKYEEGKKKKTTKISFKNGDVSKFSNEPKKQPKENWVDHKKGALKSTMDPISAMLVPAKSARDVCNRTIRVFDGVMRADVKLSYLRTIPFKTKGFKGTAVTCRAAFKPVSGYEPTKKDIIYTRDKGNIEVSFAPVGDTGLYAPVIAKAQTRIGEVRVRATRFGAPG